MAWVNVQLAFSCKVGKTTPTAGWIVLAGTGILVGPLMDAPSVPVLSPINTQFEEYQTVRFLQDKTFVKQGLLRSEASIHCTSMRVLRTSDTFANLS